MQNKSSRGEGTHSLEAIEGEKMSENGKNATGTHNLGTAVCKGRDEWGHQKLNDPKLNIEQLPSCRSHGHMLCLNLDRFATVSELLTPGLHTVFDCYFTSPVVHGMRQYKLPRAQPKCLDLIVGADLVYGGKTEVEHQVMVCMLTLPSPQVLPKS